MIFNINDYNDTQVMHCRTIFEAISFTNYLHSLGLRWSNGRRYAGNDSWTQYKEETCYNFKKGHYGTLESYKSSRCEILEWKDFMYDTPCSLIDTNNFYDKKIVSIGAYEFVKFPEENGIIPIVMRSYWDVGKFDTESSNFATSYLLDNLKNNVLPEIEAILGAENIIEFETDLISQYGYKHYGKMKSKISLPTFDFYRKHVEIFDQYRDDIGEYWWLATSRDTRTNQLCVVDENGRILNDDCTSRHKVRPILYIKASALTTQN